MPTSDDDRIPASTYETVLEIARDRTVDSRHPALTRLDLVGRAGLAGVETRVAGQAVDNLLARGRLLAYDDSKRVWLTLPDADRLRRWVREEGASDRPDRELVAWLNQRIAEVEGDE